MMAMSFSMAVMMPLTTEPSAECSAEKDSSSMLAKSSRDGFATDICAPGCPAFRLRAGAVGLRFTWTASHRDPLWDRRAALAAFRRMKDAGGPVSAKSERRRLLAPAFVRGRRRLSSLAFVPRRRDPIDDLAR